MFRFLASLLKVLFFFFLMALAYFTISDMFFYTQYFDIAKEYYDYLRMIGFVSIIYFIILAFSIIERLFKKTKNIKSKSKNGKIEVSLETINDISKRFLENKDIIKMVRVKSYSYFSKVIVNASVETYNEENLNEKLDIIQKEWKEYITLMTGITVRQATIKIVKILPEISMKTKEVDENNFENLTNEEIIETTHNF